MLAYFQLLRLPTVFTAMADIVLGYVLTRQFVYGPVPPNGAETSDIAIGWNDPAAFFGLLASSCCLYLSGMVFNDIFDQKQDADERPGRPIPSGQVPVKSAVIIGITLMLGGVTSALLVGRASLLVSLLLVIAILGYDAVLKRTFLGPIAMGSCRFLNVLLGGSPGLTWPLSLNAQLLTACALGLGIYITGVTIFARTEAKISSRFQLGLAAFVMNLGLAIVALTVISTPDVGILRSANLSPMIGMLCAVAFTVNRRSLFAIRDPSATTVQGSIKVLLLSLVMIDASLIYWNSNMTDGFQYGAAQALATAALVIPAMFLSRLIPMT